MQTLMQTSFLFVSIRMLCTKQEWVKFAWEVLEKLQRKDTLTATQRQLQNREQAVCIKQVREEPRGLGSPGMHWAERVMADEEGEEKGLSVLVKSLDFHLQGPGG